jgi:Fe(3+) dicitrate transport protein
VTTTELAAALLAPFLDPASRTWWGSLLVSAVIAGVFWMRVRPDWRLSGALAALRHPSSVLDVQLLLGRQLLGLLTTSTAVGAAWLLATHAVRRLDAAFGIPAPPPLSDLTVSILFSLVLFVCWDASRWGLHWLLHRLPRLWQLHQVHHSATVLTPLTFHRIHPVESLLYQLRSVVVTGAVTAVFFWLFREAAVDVTLLGVSALGLLLNMVTGNLRHSHVWLRFPDAVERWLLSPAQHQIHHSADPAHHDANYGTWLAVWDRLAGTLIIEDTPPEHFGVTTPNHANNLLSAWLSPLRAALTLLALVLALPAHAEEVAGEEEDTTEEEEAATDEGEVGLQMIVYGSDGTPRVAGSAHAISEEALEQFEYDNIERILLAVPGINVRSEDGFGLRPNIGIRGANSDRSAKLTLMEDGVLLAPAPYAAPAAYYFPMSTRMVGIEVFKGPAATRYGPQTVGGAINLLTRPIPSLTAGEIDVAAGMWQSAKVHGHVGTTGRAGGVLLEGVHLHSGGFKGLDGTSSDSPRGTGFDRSELMLKTQKMLSNRQRLSLKLGYSREVSNETYLGLSASDYAADPYRRYAATAQGRMAWDRTQAELALTSSLSNKLQIRTVAYHHFMDRTWTKFNRFASDIDIHDLLISDSTSGQAAVYLAILRGEEDSASAEQTLLIGSNNRVFHSFGLQSTARLSSYGERTSSVLEGGIRLHGDDVVRIHDEAPYDMVSGALSAAGDTEITLDSHATAAALAAFVHEDFRIDRLHILPGARLELIRTNRLDEGDDPEDPVTRANVLPGLGVLYGLTDWVDAFAGAYRGFSPVAPGQPEAVEPELSWNYEAGVRTMQGDRHIELVGFFNDYTNITGQCTLSGGCDTDQVDQQFNGGAVWIYGLEAAAGYTVLLPGELSIPLSGTFTWTQSAFQTGFASGFDQFGTVEIGDSLPYAPRLQASGNLTLAHTRGSLSTGISWHGGMLDEAGVWPDDLTGDGSIPPLLLLDAALHATLTERASVYVTGTNLSGSTAITSWRPLGARPTAPRTVMVGFKAER